MIDDDGVLERLNKAKRKKLMAFLKQHGTEDSRIIPASDLPKNNRTDKGTIAVFFVGQNIYYPEYQDFFCLVDTLDKDGKETFMDFYKRQSVIAELLGIDQTPTATNEPTYDPRTQYIVERDKVGRPKRTLSDTEKAKIDELRAQGKGYNAIAKELKVSNRLIMRHCQKR